MKFRILHLGGESQFINSLQEFIKSNFDESVHFYLLTGKSKKPSINKNPNVLITVKTVPGRFMHYLLAVIRMHRSEKIILHSLSDPRLVLLLFFMPWLLKKCYWVMWGSDLYIYQLGERNWKWKIREFFRRPVIKNISVFTTTVPGDYDLAKKWYGIKASFIQNLMYPSHVYRNADKINCSKEKCGLFFIQVGNSADSSNNHVEIFEYLSKYKDVNFKVFCPLSYGSTTNRACVIKRGYELLGEKFFPMTELMSFDEYNNYMACIDLAIFNHDRQQAMGNTIGFLSLGKKVVIKKNVTPFSFFKSIGVKVYSIEDDNLLKPLENNIKKTNISIMKTYFTKERLASNWKDVFDG